MRVMKIGSIILLGLFLSLLACNKKNGPEPEPAKYKWTILGYFNGNNSEDQTPEGHSYAIQDVQELEQMDSTEEVQVVVMLGSFKTDGNCKYYHIRRRLNEPADTISSPVLLHLGNKDMSNPNTLRDFISYGLEHYPAENTILIISDHGGGWRGLCSDTINGDGNWMSLLELSSALSGHKLFLVWFYGPLMATTEVAYQIRDRAEYMIGSQFKWYPKNYLGSTEWLQDLTDNPNLNHRVFVNGIIDAMRKAAEENPEVKNAHSSLINLTKISQLATDVSSLAQSLIDSTGSDWDEVWYSWYWAREIYHSDSTVVDLREFVRELQKKPDLNSFIKETTAKNVETRINEAVLKEFIHFKGVIYPKDITIFGGISIHLPLYQQHFDSTDYAQLYFSETNWPHFLSIFIQTYAGDFSGALEVISLPTGARVFLNGTDTGYETYVIIDGLTPGDYRVKFVKSGFPEKTVKAQVFPRDTTTVFGNLYYPL